MKSGGHAHDIIVIGASAGGVDALRALVAGLPPDLPAAVFVVLHMTPRSKSVLPYILSLAGPLPAVHAENGLPIQPGHIYVAQPDHHLLIAHGQMHVGLGPKESYQRPSINVTFRSAAQAYGDQVIGVILTGQLDDGTAGLWEINQCGGVSVVQNPEEAAFPSMPLSALREIEIDYTVRLAEIGPLLARLAREGVQADKDTKSGRPEVESKVADLNCPECRGTVWEVPRGEITEYRCRVGHAFSARAMLAQHSAVQETTIWAAIIAMQEGAVLAQKLAERLQPEIRQPLLDEAGQRRRHAEVMRQILSERTVFGVD